MTQVLIRTLNVIFIFVSMALSSSDVLAAKYHLHNSIHDGQKLPFQSFVGAGKWDNYLVMTLPFNPIADLFKQLLIQKQRPLTSRGEAHITVITPVEYWNVLKTKLSIEEINYVATNEKIQNSGFEIICLGSGTATVDEKEEQTYFVVVDSKDLLNIRRKIQSAFVQKGGNPHEFNPAQYLPHITVGFTKRDLHESDGIIKDRSACSDQITEWPYR